MEDKIRERFFSKVRKTESCWEWTSDLDWGGCARFSYRGTSWKASRVIWTETYGEIPEGFMVMHTCDNRACINPEHLVLGDAKSNSLDMIAKGRHASQIKTHCPQNHPYDGENLWLGKNGARHCLTCAKARSKKNQQKPEVAEKRRAANREYHRLNKEKISLRKKLNWKFKNTLPTDIH